MKIAFVIYSAAVISGKSNGVRSQALSWKQILEKNNENQVDLINTWMSYDWKSYDAIHIFGYDLSLLGFVSSLIKYNQNIYISPIVDSTKPYWKYRLATYNGLSKLRLFSVNYILKKSMIKFKGICVRTNHESGYFTNSMKVSKAKVYKVPLSYGVDLPNNIEKIISNKENFCLHVSSLYQDRKNVKRLIDSAIKYNFNLKLVGNTGSENQTKTIKSWIQDASNVELLGYVEYNVLLDLYKRAKVFALPSTCEGVGIVALDAAVYGCNIAITNIKGPKEYYLKLPTVKTVNPIDIEELGLSIVELLAEKNSLDLYNFVSVQYAPKKVNFNLNQMYKSNG